MESLPDRSRADNYASAYEWEPSPEIDGFVWELGPEPDEADARWAATALNGDDWHTDEPTPDEFLDADPRDLDQEAGEALAQDQLERGIPLF